MTSEKHYIGELEIRCGDYEFTRIFKFKARDPDAALMALAGAYYGERDYYQDPDGDHILFNGGEVAVTPGNWQEIDKNTFDALTILTEL